MLSCANKLPSERYRSSLKGAGTTPFFLLVLISYFRFDHSYPDTTELLLFLLFLLSPCSAFTVRSAYGCTTTQSAESDNAFLSHLGYHGIMDASLLANFFSRLLGMALPQQVVLHLAIVLSFGLGCASFFSRLSCPVQGASVLLCATLSVFLTIN